MKILHLISGGDSGGAKTALYTLFSSPSADQIRVGCLTDGIFFRGLDALGVDHILFRQKSRFDLSVVGSIAEMISRDGFDILHAHGARANFVAAFVRRRTGVTTVTTVHSDYLRDFESPIKKLVFTPLNMLALTRIPYRIAVSDSFREMLIRRGFAPNSIFTVYNGLDADSISPSLSRADFYARHSLSLPDGAVVFGCAARLDRVKGADVLIRAAARVIRELPDAVFLFAGDGGERKRLISLSRRLGIEGSVHFLGRIDDVASFYAAIDANVIPSRSESFPYSMLEGAALSLPTVAADVGGIPIFIRDGQTGLLFPVGDADALAARLITLARDPELAKRLGNAARKRLADSFSVSRAQEAHTDIYKRIISREHATKADGRSCDFAVSGYYGYGNVGDDAVLGAIISGIREKRPDATFTVLSRRPRQTRLWLGVDARFRYGSAVGRALARSRVLISGGGTLMQDKTSSRSLRYYLSVIKKAKKHGTAVIQYANGFGPIKSARNLSFAVRVINENVNVITARDSDALDSMKRAGISVRAELSADPTLLSSPSEKTAVSRDYVAVSVRHIDGRTDAAMTVAEAISAICAERGLRPVYIVMHPQLDRELSLAAARASGGEVIIPSDADEAYAILEGAALAVTMRLHAAVFAVHAKTPVVAVAYDEKVTGFMRHARLDACLDARSITADNVKLAAERVMSQPASTELDRMSALASVSLDEALRLLCDRQKNKP